jgi:predicted nucleotidyltransferase
VPRALDELLVTASRTLNDEGVAHALIGGCARNVYAPPRSTRDVDFAVTLTRPQYERIAAALRALGFGRLTETPSDDGGPPHVALFSDDTGGRIDLLVAHTEFERGAIARARPVVFSSLQTALPVVRAEDLIVYKLLAARPRDLVDIEEIAKSQERAGALLDWSHIEQEAASWDASELLERVRQQLASARR